MVEKPDDKVVVSGDEIKKLQDMVVYRFWLRELNTLDLQDITAQAQINNMTESEYLARNGEVLWNLYFIQAVPRAETIADYSSYIENPSSNRDPKGELRLFDYWYTLDEFGNRVRLNLTDPTSNILDDKTTTVNVYAAWKDGTVGSDEEEKVDHEDLVDKNPVPVDLTAKAAASYEDEDGNTKSVNLPVYHGDTFKAMEVGDDEDYHFAFDKIEGVVHIPTEIPALEDAFELYHDRLNCFIVEPLLQGAGGMRMYDISFLKRARELCNQYDVLLIFDEVATGFGRTGNRFVSDLVLPDILVLGKALTGGYIGHAVTVANHKVFDAFYSDDDRLALMHGPTFMGNPLACAVALKGIEIFERDDYMSKIRHIEQISRQEMENFSDPRIKEVRIMGGCTCVEVHDPKTLEGFQQFAYERGVFCRPFLNYMYSMVPYVISDEELIQIFDVMKDWFH